MNNSQTHHQRISAPDEALLQRFFDRKLSESDEIRLFELLQNDDNFLEYAAQNCELEYLLHFFGKLQSNSLSFSSKEEETLRLSDSFSPFVQKTLDSPQEGSFDWSYLIALAQSSEALPVCRLVDGKDTDYSSSISSSSPSKNEKGIFRWIPPQILILSLLFLFVFAIYIEFFYKSNIPISSGAIFLGKVNAAVDIVPGEDGFSYKTGQKIDEKENVRFQSGVMEIELANGVRLILEGPVDFRVDSLLPCYIKNLG